MDMIRHFRAVAAVGLTLALLAAAACGGSPPASGPVGAIVADAGFRPNLDGFPFENYGDVLANGSSPTNLTVDDVRTMFGTSVCADASSGKCDLIPEAQAWLDDTNQAMDGGHCFGFSVAAQLLWEEKLKVSTLGASDTTGLAIANNAVLQRLLAYDWTLQLLDSVQSHRVNGTPDDVLGALRKELKPHPSETYTIAFWKRDGTGGHAVTPYAVQNKGAGKFDVLIYDNNWPGRTRAISFDTKADIWTYDAAINPTQPSELYEGDAQTKTISLFPTSPGLGTQKCPFCGKVPKNPATSGAEAHKTEEIYLMGSDTHHANLIVTDHAGRRLGYVNGALVQQIPGAHVDRLISNQDWTDNLEPDFFVPAKGTYTITIDGSALSSPDTETVGIIGPSSDVSVKDIPMMPGDKDTLVAAPDATRVSYASSRAESPTLQVGVSDTRADYAFTVAGVSDRPGSTITLTLPAEGGRLTVDDAGTTQSSTVSLTMSRETGQGTQVFRHDAISLAGGDTAELQFGNWPGASRGIPLVIAHNGRRTTQILTDQATG
jgi:hypothetical protein